jgi:putative phosphoserine phosphatase/1-acylglycerol-3-phosphate O-acyltransferase
VGPSVRAPQILTPNARIEFDGIENIPSTGPAILVFNHRSYFDPIVMALVIAKTGRNVRGLGKKEVFDVPIVGRIMKASGGIRVDRGTGSDEPLEAAIAAVEAGELLMIAPEGTIPAVRRSSIRCSRVVGVPLGSLRRPGAGDPDRALGDREGVAAQRSAAEVLAHRSSAGHRHVGPPVRAEVPQPRRRHQEDHEGDQRAAPAGGPQARTPTPEELALTYPPGYHGDPEAELSAARAPTPDAPPDDARMTARHPRTPWPRPENVNNASTTACPTTKP